MATYSNNTTIKIGSPVAIRNTGSGSTTYTVPNNCHLDLIYTNVDGAGSGLNFYIKSSANTFIYNYTGNTTQTHLFENSGLRLPAGSVIYMDGSVAKSVREIIGTLFINTP
ncbi:MAG TPA: hypothetical protein PK522_00740 [Nitrosomonas sp.]|nr:hypothetical protein [Nitrosomonas sp.]